MCPHCDSRRIIKKGFYERRVARGTPVQRYFCKDCRRTYSGQTGSSTYREKKPHLNQRLARLLCHGVSQRAAAEILGIHPVTVARKLVRLAARARDRLLLDIEQRSFGPVLVFDEMETFEHSKCKPLSIALAVEEGTRRIVAVEVAQMPAKGLLAKASRRRYGPRRDDRPLALRAMFRRMDLANAEVQVVKSDESPRYPRRVRQHFPKAVHETHRGRRGCVVGQGELKAIGRDPLFSLNHTAAMIRDRLKRMSRRTWCTTKRPDRLQALLDLYAWFHNARLDGMTRTATV